MIKVMWSPQLAIMERRINRHSLTDSTVDFYDRLATYEGLELHSTPESLTVPQLVSDIQKICSSIVDHIKLISGGNVSITRLTLYFKQDSSDRLWLLFCGGVQIFDLDSEKSKGPTAELSLRLPAPALSKRLIKGTNYFELQANRAPCPGCNLLAKLDELYAIKFDLLVKCWEQGFPEPPNKVEVAIEKVADEEQASDAVPNIIKRAIAGVTNEKYAAMRANLAWMDSTTKVCEGCYLHYSGFVVLGKPEKERKRPLKPEKATAVGSGDEDLLKESSMKKSFSWAKSRLVSPTSFVSTPKTVNLRSQTSYYKVRKDKGGKTEEAVHRLRGRFTAKNLPALINIYSSQRTPLDLSRSTGISSHNSSHPQIRLSELSPMEQTSLLQDTIKSLKMCLLDGVHP